MSFRSAESEKLSATSLVYRAQRNAQKLRKERWMNRVRLIPDNRQSVIAVRPRLNASERRFCGRKLSADEFCARFTRARARAYVRTPGPRGSSPRSACVCVCVFRCGRATAHNDERAMHIYDLRCAAVHVAELCLVPHVTKGGKSIIIAAPTDTRSRGFTG